ncbi:MAG: hypothetical protein KGH66_01775 [Candidatus Micrarchaeota archaeon]|nr:hypothetical protein [Candidatus Micrarchaeota archaeon]
MDGITKNMKTVIDYVKGDASPLEDLAKLGKKLGTDLDTFSLEIKHGDFKDTPTKELISLFREYVDKFSALGVYLSLPLSIERYLQDNIREGLKGIVYSKTDMTLLLIELTSPIEHDALYKERVDLLKIAEKYHSGLDVGKDIMRHIDEYGNVCIRWCMGSPWSKEELMTKIKGIKDAKQQLAKLKHEDDKIKRDFDAFVKLHSDKKKLIEDIKVTKWYTWLRTYRTEILSGSIANIYPLLSELARRLGITLEDIKYYTIDDILSGKPVAASELARRREAFVILFLSSKMHYFSGDDAKYFIDYWRLKNVVLKEIKGVVANRPVDTITGIAKIVISMNDLSKVKAGDIMVAPMTEPNFVPAMERAAAFLTDEGGILCHAAIVGREMNKPCIIGTGNATKVLKDGDKIRLNLADGTVEILSGHKTANSEI